MSLKAIFQKLKKGEDLNALEQAELDQAEGLADKVEELEGYKAKFEEAEDANKTDLQKLQGKLDKALAKNVELEKSLEAKENEKNAVIAERDAEKGKHDALVRKGSISAIASKHNYEDPEHLEYVLGKQNVDITDEAKVTAFMEQLKKDSPKHFKAEKSPGPGAPPVDKDKGNASTEGYRGRMQTLAEEVGNAPVIG